MEDFEKEIDKVLSGEITLAQSHTLISPHKVDEYLKSESCEQEDFDSNGWNWDFWMTYSKDDKKFTLSGGGWYNNGLTFSVT
ncbi:MAG TPA: hypothetical protein VLA48_03090 [Nitrososphaeraceae archaeon]|nr:hypothetical protein [Nitrososphaeraceae archaeon]